MPRCQSVRLCLLNSEFSMSAKALEEVTVKVYQIKKAYLQIQHQTTVFTSNQTEHLPY